MLPSLYTPLSPAGGWFLLYPSLTFCCLLLLPLGLVCNALKREVQFDFPQAQAQAQGGEGGMGELRPKAA
jgi:hypothetical protein